MKYYISKTTKGFYPEDIFGSRTIKIPDPNFSFKSLEIELLPNQSVWDYDGEYITNTSDNPITVKVKDKSQEVPTIEVANKDCKLPEDAVEITYDTYVLLRDGSQQGREIAFDEDTPYLKDKPLPSFEEKKKQLTSAVQFFMDSKARDMGYDDLKTAVTYAEEPAVPKFQAEGKALRAWRSMVWAYCYELLDKVEKAEVEEPTLDYVLSNLPSLSL